MKGLLLKQWFQVSARKITLLLPVLFLILYAFNTGDIFFSTMPLLLVPAITEGCYSMDETSGWLSYQRTLPVSNRTLVGSYYLFTVFAMLLVSVLQIGMLLLMGAPRDQMLQLGLILSMIMVDHSVNFVELIRFGNGKIRMIRIVNVALLFSVLAIVSSLDPLRQMPLPFSGGMLLPALMGLGILAEYLSFLASVRLYDKNRITI